MGKTSNLVVGWVRERRHGSRRSFKAGFVGAGRSRGQSTIERREASDTVRAVALTLSDPRASPGGPPSLDHAGAGAQLVAPDRVDIGVVEGADALEVGGPARRGVPSDQG